ncbi:hypothetical protein RV15_GL001688 [Enterococcus silesiacus]|nr:hypothetical protein RV15_GL001688 [Enterococcus silesiacus]
MEGKALKTAKKYYEQVYIPVIENLSCVIEDANQEMIRYQLDFSEQVTSSVGEQIDTDQLETAENRIEQEIQRYIEIIDEFKKAPLADMQQMTNTVRGAESRKNELKAKREKVESFEGAHSNHFSNIITEIQHIQTMINSFKNGIPFNSDGSAYVLTSGQKASMNYLSECTEQRKEKENESAPPDIGDRVWMEINEGSYREWVLVEKGTYYATQADLIVTKKYKEWALKYGKVEVMKEYSTAEFDYHLAIINTGIDPNTGFPVEDWEKWRSWGFVLSTVSTVAISVYGTYKMYKGAVTAPSSSKKASGSEVPKLSTLTEAERLRLANQYKKKSPINIPEDANIKAQSKNGYEQISYKWKENGETIEVRWHTRTPGAPEGQGNTFVVEKTIPGTADGQRRSQQILVGKDKWVSKNDWQKAITDRKNGVSTPEQDKMLTEGHWKE